MSDTPPNNPGPDQGNGQPRKRRRRRKRKNNKPNTNAAEQSADGGQASSSSPAENANTDAPSTGNGYRGKSDQPDASRRRGRGKPGAKPTGGRNTGDDRGPRNDKPQKRPGAPAPQAKQGKPKKRRKPRTKQCVHCYTPCTTIHRVRLDYRKQWVFICDICWPTRCIDNPHYEFGGTWVSGRIVKPESQLRDEAQAKRNQKHTHDKPKPQEDQPKHQPNPAEASTPANEQQAETIVVEESNAQPDAEPSPEQGQGG